MAQRSVNRKGWGGGGASLDEKVKTSAADTITGYLHDKIAAGAGIAKTILNPGANEELELKISSIPAAFQPQWISAGAFEPLSANTYKSPAAQEITGADDVSFTTLRFNSASADAWFFTLIPPEGWSSGKITFIPHYLVIDPLGTPQTMIFELGAEYMADGFLPNTAMAWQTVTSTKTAGSADVPQYIIGPESAELTLTGSPASSGALALRIKRGSDAESDPLYFIGLKLKYV